MENLTNLFKIYVRNVKTGTVTTPWLLCGKNYFYQNKVIPANHPIACEQALLGDGGVKGEKWLTLPI